MRLSGKRIVTWNLDQGKGTFGEVFAGTVGYVQEVEDTF